jgi:hypothetical protein
MVWCPEGTSVVSGGGTCTKGDILIGSSPLSDSHKDGWKIDCDSAVNTYGKKVEECTVYAVCFWTTYKDVKSDY